MNDKFDKFTERARRVMSLAQQEAQRFNHNYIGTEHLLLGLLAEGDGIGAQALIRLGVELEKAREALEFIIGRGDRIVLGEIGLTPRAKKVIELAVDEARRLGHHYIGTEHILLGLVREGEGIAAGVLESLGVNLEKVRREVLEILGQPHVAPATEPPATESPTGLVTSMFTLVCRDVDATRAFYVDYLGAIPLPLGGPASANIPAADQLLRMPHSGPMIGLRAADPVAGSATPTGAGAVELSFFVRDVGAFWNELHQRNAPNLAEAHSLPGAPAMRAFTLTDPDGRTLRFHGTAKG